MASKTIRDIETQLASKEVEYAAQEEITLALLADVNALRRTLEILTAVEEEEAPEETQPAKIVRNTMVDILKDDGKPLYYGEILDRLKQRGVAVAGRDQKKNVSAHLSLDDRFESHGSGIWGLVSWKTKQDAPKTSLRDTPAPSPFRVSVFAMPDSDSPDTPDVEQQEDDEAQGEFDRYMTSLRVDDQAIEVDADGYVPF